MITEVERIRLRKSFAEICNKFSLYRLYNKNIYIRHRSPKDELETDFYYDTKYKELISGGVFTEKDKLDYLISNGLWSQKQEDQITFSKTTIQDLYLTKRKLFKFSEIEHHTKEIKTNEDFLIKILNERAEAIGETAEQGARKYSDLLLIQKSFFKNPELTEFLYTKESFENLSMDETDELFITYHNLLNDLNDLNIRKIAISDFFQNLFYLVENVTDFFGGSIVDLTHHQSKLLTYGSHFKTILTSNNFPPEIMDDPEKIEDYHAGRQNINKVIESNQNESGVVSLVGVTPKELKFYGLDDPITESVQKQVIPERQGGELSLDEAEKYGFF